MRSENGGAVEGAAAAKQMNSAEPTAFNDQRNANTGHSGAPQLSALGQRVLRDAQERDLELRCTTKFEGLWEALAHIASLTDDDRERLALDGLRWRHWCSLSEVARRREQVRRDEARLACESEASIRAEIQKQGGIGASHAELQERRRRLPQSYLDRLRRYGPHAGGGVDWHTGRPLRGNEGGAAA